MKIISDPFVDVQEWDALAASLGGGYFHCHAEPMYDSTCHATDPIFVRATDDRGECIGVATGTIAKSRVWPFSKHCSYAMLYGLPATANRSEQTERAFMEELEGHLKSKGVFSVHLYGYDSPRCQSILSSLAYALSARFEFYVDLTPDLSEIWSRLRPQRRADIRKAEKLGVETRLENTGRAHELVFLFQEQSMRRRGILLAEVQEQTVRARQGRLQSSNVDVLVSYQKGDPVNAALFGAFNNRPYYLVSGSSDLGFKCCGTAHLIWTAIKTYKERGATWLNLGAAMEDQQGLYEFKKDFGATIVSQPIGKKRISKVGSGLHLIRSFLRR